MRGRHTKLSFSLNWPGHMHKWCFPAVLRCTSKYRPWWREIRRRRTDGRIGLASAGATARDPHPTARVSLAVGLARPHMPLSPTQFPPVPGVAHSHKGHRVALGRFCPITCGAGDRLGPTLQREHGRWPRVAVVWWPQLWSWPVGPDRTGRWICFLPSRASWLERLLCMEAPRVFYFQLAFEMICYLIIQCSWYFRHVYVLLSSGYIWWKQYWIVIPQSRFLLYIDFFSLDSASLKQGCIKIIIISLCASKLKCYFHQL